MVNTVNSGSVTGSNAYTPVKQDKAEDKDKTKAAEKNTTVKDQVTIGDNTKSSGIYGKADGSKTHGLDAPTIEKLKSQADRATEHLRSIVEKLILKQGKSSDGILKNFSPEDIAKAKQDISEDGEFGVKQTSDRIVQFAIAISGGDKSKLSQLKDAIEKGFSQVSGAFGGKLPDICSKTHDEIMKKLDAWAGQNDTKAAETSGTTDTTAPAAPAEK